MHDCLIFILTIRLIDLIWNYHVIDSFMSYIMPAFKSLKFVIIMLMYNYVNLFYSQERKTELIDQ